MAAASVAACTAVVAGGLVAPAAAAPIAPSAPAVSSPAAASGLAVFVPPAEVNRSPEGVLPADPYAATVQQTSPSSTTSSANVASTAVAADSLGASGASPAAGDGLGVQPFYGLETFALADGLTAQVNLSNGNLVVRSTDRAVNGPGLSLQLDRFYNARSTGAGTFGQRSVLSTGRDVGLTVAGSTVTFSGPSGFTAAFTANGSGGYTAPAGVNADLAKNTDGTFVLTYRSSSERLTFTAGGFLTSDADRNGNALTYAYNADNTLASITDAAGRVTTLGYANGRATQLTDPSGRSNRYDYDAAGNLIRAYDGNGLVTTYRYNGSGQLTGLQTAGGSWTAFAYDSTGRVTTVTRYLTVNQDSGDAAVTAFAYTSGQTVQTDPRGGNTTYAFDAQGRVTRVTDPLGRARSQSWTANSDVATAVDAMGTGGTGGNTTTYSYDSNNSRTAVQLPTGAAARAQYATGSGCQTTDTTHPYQAKCTSDAQGNRTGLTYDGPGNVTAVTDTTAAGGVTQTYTYQRPAGATTGTNCGAKPGQQCTATDGKGAVTTFAYNSNGDLTRVTPPAPLAPTNYTYDSLSRLITVVDGNGTTINYQYDSNDWVHKIQYSGAGEVNYGYDRDGRVTNQSDTTNANLTYTYDALGREVARTVPGNASQTLVYDKSGNLTAFTDAAGTVAYGYDAANQLLTLAEPGTTCPATGSPAGCTRFSYDANGNRLTTTYPGGTVQRATIDNSGRTTRLLATTAGGTVLSDLGYRYTATGATGATADRTLVQARVNTVAVGAPNGSTTAYSYDSLSRLTQAREALANGTVNANWAYSYDAAGNRTRETVTAPGGAVTTTNYTYNAADQLTTRNGTGGYTYDANGNQTAAPAVPATTLSPVATPATTHTYNGRDQVTATTSGNARTPFTYAGGDNSGRLTAGPTTFQSSSLGLINSNGAENRSFIRTPSGELIAMRTSSGMSYFLADNQGSIVGLVNSSGSRIASYAYNPYGETRTIVGASATDRAAADANPFRYIGGYFDSNSNLYALLFRYYSPAQAAFTQQDPSGQERNAYSYTAADPINGSDPRGTKVSLCAVGGIALGAATFAASGGTAALLGGAALAAGVADAAGCGNRPASLADSGSTSYSGSDGCYYNSSNGSRVC